MGCVDDPKEPVRCAPGYYSGKTDGVYRSTAGLAPGVLVLPETPNATTWHLNLRRSETDEFSLIGDGCIHVVEAGADPVASDGRSRTLIEGAVDCRTGKYQATVRGYYTAPSSVLGGEQKFYYKGTLEATYDAESESFTGAYEIREPIPLLGGNPGGEGAWLGKLSTDAPPDDSGECLIGGFPEEMFKATSP